MRQATGELNMTLVIVIGCAMLSSFFFLVLWPMIKDDFLHDSTCANAVCDSGFNIDTGMARCINPTKKDEGFFECPYKG